jgi:hypothetical protein
MCQDQITLKRGNTERKAGYSISSLVTSVNTRHYTNVTEATSGRNELMFHTVMQL